MAGDLKYLAVMVTLVVVVLASVSVYSAMATGNMDGAANTGFNKSSQNGISGNKSAYGGTGGQSPGYVPIGGPAGTGPKWEGVGPHQKCWMGGAMNPWVYGPSAYPRRPGRYGWKAPGMTMPGLNTGKNKT